MQSLMKTCALSLMFAGLAACGGSGGGGKTPDPAPIPNSSSSSLTVSSSSSSTISSSAPASSSIPSSSSAPASSLAASETSSSLASSSTADSESTLTATSYTGYTLAKIENCGINISAPEKSFAIFADYDGGVQNQSLATLGFYNWNHVGTVNSKPIPNEWDNITLSAANYNIPGNAATNSSCNNVDSVNTILVKKIANWDRQHSNGFGRSFTSFGQKFGNVENLVLDVKVNSAKTKMHTPAELKTVYTSYLSNTSVIDTIEAGKVNLGLTFETSNNLRAAITIEIDQALYADQWVRITIPASSLRYYEDINYVQTTRDASLFSNLVINNLLVVAETRTNAVLRGSISGWNENTPPPERFKEVDISFKKIELQLK